MFFSVELLEISLLKESRTHFFVIEVIKQSFNKRSLLGAWRGMWCNSKSTKILVQQQHTPLDVNLEDVGCGSWNT